MSKIVIALGGNALGNSSKEQLAKAQTAAKSIVDLIEQGHQVVIAHGNGPQVGKIRLAFEETSQSPEDVVPFPECTAMSQGYIGYHLQIVIACGGGGVPIAYDGPVYHGVDAVIDKDFAAAKMAELIEADVFVVLTAVEHVFVKFGQANQQALTDVTVTAMQQYIEEDQFAPGSMLPKVEAAISFAESKPNRQAIIGLLELASEAIKGESGTRITQ